MSDQNLYDVTIIGGGPAGLYSSFYSGLRHMKTKIIEYQPFLGGKVHVYPEKMIWDVGGLPPTPGATLIKQLVEQGLTFDPTVVLNEKVKFITQNNHGIFELHASSGNVHYSKTIIIAVGSGILNPQKLNLEGAQRFEVTNLNYTVKSLARFKDKTVIISGGGNSAIDWANELAPIAKHVLIACRKGNFSCHEAQAAQLQNSSITCFFHSSITKLIARKNEHMIEKVEITNSLTGEVIYCPVDEVIVNHGYERDISLLEKSTLKIDRVEKYFIAGNANSESSIPGVYAAGDILMHDGKLNLIAGAFQDAANAVNKAKQYIEPKAEKAAMVSSHHEVFKERNKHLVNKLTK